VVELELLEMRNKILIWDCRKYTSRLGKIFQRVRKETVPFFESFGAIVKDLARLSLVVVDQKELNCCDCGISLSLGYLAQSALLGAVTRDCPELFLWRELLLSSKTNIVSKIRNGKEKDNEVEVAFSRQTADNQATEAINIQ